MVDTTITTTPKILYTSLAEIKSFKPCIEGWRNILKGQRKTEVDDVLFPILEAVESNSISNICWLLGKRKVEIQICVKFARMCADSVQKYKNTDAASADAAATAYAAVAADAADAAAAAIYADADAAAADAAAAAIYADAAADAADAADAAIYADASAAVAADAAYAADVADASADAADAAIYKQQKELNKQFLIQCINEYQNGELS